ncbi:hypothetical protein [Neoaquamicrobium sediminum]|uniref:hypothetical protein n=2 Tax=Neoaquamicrobium sediminum TaxID=1849104 RepID=UPI0015662A78|nr:hypothetical protein [Mesorhizobium sediminum]NRC54169.1 hypothetical protein [Mesorhizobium sediminum]
MTLTLILHFLMLLACVVAASLLAPRRPGKGHPVEWGKCGLRQSASRSATSRPRTAAMKLSDAIAYCEREIARADYIDNTARMLDEKQRWSGTREILLQVQERRAPEIRELVG